MGHVESGGEVAGAPAKALKPARRRRQRHFWRPRNPPHPVWALWWSLKGVFAIWNAPSEAMGSPGSWSYFGNDFVTGLRRNDSTEKAFALIDAAPDQFDGVVALARLNLTRHEQMFNFVALVYFSIPVTVLLGAAELMPGNLIAAFKANQFAFWYMLSILTFVAAVYLVGLWRARQLVSVLELWRIERGGQRH